MGPAGQGGVIVVAGAAAGTLVTLPVLVPVAVPLDVGGVALVLFVLRLTAGDDARFRRWLMRWTLAALAVHVLCGLVIHAVVGLGSEDAVYYDLSAKAIVNHWDFGSPLPDFLPGKVTFFYAVAGLYRAVGPHAEALIAVNAVLGAALVPVVTDTSRRLFGLDAVRAAPAIVTLLPGVLLWTSLPLREASVLLLVALAVNMGVRVSQGPGRLALVGFVAVLAALLTLRLHVAVTVAAGVVLAMMVSRRPSVASRAVLLAGGFVLSVVVMGRTGMPGMDAVEQTTLSDVNASRVANSETSTSGFSRYDDATTLGKAAMLTVLSLPESFAGPFPWQLRTIRHLAVLPECVAWWLLLPMLWVGLRAGFSLAGPDMLLAVLPALFTQLLFTMGIGDFGTLFRQRPQVAVLLVPVIALGLSRRPSISWQPQVRRPRVLAS